MEKLQELEPCPFCDGDAVLVDCDEMENMGKTVYPDQFAVLCENCCCSTGTYNKKSLAIEAWNRRPEHKPMNPYPDTRPEHTGQYLVLLQNGRFDVLTYWRPNPFNPLDTGHFSEPRDKYVTHWMDLPDKQ